MANLPTGSLYPVKLASFTKSVTLHQKSIAGYFFVWNIDISRNDLTVFYGFFLSFPYYLYTHLLFSHFLNFSIAPVDKDVVDDGHEDDNTRESNAKG